MIPIRDRRLRRPSWQGRSRPLADVAACVGLAAESDAILGDVPIKEKAEPDVSATSTPLNAVTRGGDPPPSDHCAARQNTGGAVGAWAVVCRSGGLPIP